MSLSSGTGAGVDPSSRGRLSRDIWLLVILAIGLGLRLQYVQLPMAEAHSWRQITNADIARNFTEISGNILYPQVSWGGPRDAYVSMEFPLIHWIAGMLFHLTSRDELVCRLIANRVLDAGDRVRLRRRRAPLQPGGRPRRRVPPGDLAVVRILRPDVHLRHADGVVLDRRHVGPDRLRAGSRSTRRLVGHWLHHAGVHGEDPGGADVRANRVAGLHGRAARRRAAGAAARDAATVVDRRDCAAVRRHGALVRMGRPAVSSHRPRPGHLSPVGRLLTGRCDRDGANHGGLALEHAAPDAGSGVLRLVARSSRTTCI